MKRQVAGLVAGLLVPVVALAAYSVWPRSSDYTTKLALAAGVSPKDLHTITRADASLRRKKNVSDEQWNRLVQLSYDGNRTTRAEAFDAIADAYGTPREGSALAEVRRMKNDPWNSVRGGYVFALIRLRSDDWKDAADAASRDSDELVRVVSKDAVARIAMVHRVQDKYR